MDGVESLTTLRKLELYDNQIESISAVEKLSNLTILDLSFNAIRALVPLQCCPLLQELYVAQNKLRKIEGLDGLVHLRTLDLGANRIRVRRLVAFPCPLPHTLTHTSPLPPP